MKFICAFFSFLFFLACNTSSKEFGTIERTGPALDNIIAPGAKVEIIADGFEWTEGPVWIESKQMLLFSDIPNNAIYKWTETKGKELYLKPAGYTDTVQRGGETGSNGLAINKEGKLILCQHGNRQIAMMEADINNPEPVFKTIAGTWQSKKFNSPNDLALRSNGDIFFTDPPYGLEKNMDDPLKEIPFQGVYKTTADGHVKLLIDSITRPNGILLVNNEKSLIVANSDGEKPYWYMYDLDASDSLINPRIFYDPSAEEGAPDGMKADSKGNIYSTGPGGIWIFDQSAKLLGKIRIPGRVSNVALTTDEKTLFITADNYLLRVKMRE